MRATRLFFFSFALFVLTTGAMTAIAVSTPAPGGDTYEHAVKYWTFGRMANAQTRDFVYNPETGEFDRSSRKPSADVVLGAPYRLGGEVTQTTGKVYFTMGSTDYMCSGSVVDDLVASRSFVLTAAHCAYDETNLRFARNWIFVPAFADSPTPYDPDRQFCSSTKFGCWHASALVVSTAYAHAGGFNDTAAMHDYAFAVLGDGGKSLSELDDIVGSQAISYVDYTEGSDAWLFGYPAARQYKGVELTYCRGPLGFDQYSENDTYRVACKMTGGSSGGPWMSPFVSSGSNAGTGTIFSLNSYGYRGIVAMYGPKLNAETEAMYVVAATANEDTLVS